MIATHLEFRRRSYHTNLLKPNNIGQVHKLLPLAPAHFYPVIIHLVTFSALFVTAAITPKR